MDKKISGIDNYDFNQNNSDDEVEQISEILKQQVNSLDEINNSHNLSRDSLNSEENKKKRKHNKLKHFIYVISIFMIMLLIFIITPAGKKIIVNMLGSYMYGKLETQPNQSIDENENIDKMNNDNIKAVNFEHINILLLGAEEFGGALNTDSMMVATINPKQKTLKLTSLMRDLYVNIPGYSNNKLNSVYKKGGFELLKETLYEDFGITTSEYILVDFDSLKKVIDILGGIDVTLTANEAKYLNTTNYISDPNNRNVHEGKQLMNGDQVLGYCRVRYVSTGTESNDFGRTQRQRIVLNTVYDKLKGKNIVELILVMNKILNNANVTTNISESNFKSYLNEVVKLNLDSIENYRIPSDGNYKNLRVDIGKLKNQAVLVPKDWEETKIEIHDFIYGKEGESITTTSGKE